MRSNDSQNNEAPADPADNSDSGLRRFGKYFILSPRNRSNMIIVLAGVLMFAIAINFGKLLGLLSCFSLLFTSAIVGLSVAFILNAPTSFFEQKIFRFKNKVLRRRLSIALSFITATAVLVFIVSIIAPKLTESLVTLAEAVPDFLQSASKQLRASLAERGIAFSFAIPWDAVADFIFNWLKTAGGDIAGLVHSTTTLLIGICAGIGISAMLLDRKEAVLEKTKKAVTILLHKKLGGRVIRVSQMVYKSLYRFIIGQAKDSLILGCICFVCMLILQFPYALLISVIVTVTNIIPIVGPFIGAVPGALFIMVENPIQGLLFIVFITVLQQFDANILGPRVMGDIVGLTPLWLMFSITIFGGLFGIIGIILAIPVFSVVYAVVKSLVEQRLENKGRPSDTMDYLHNKVESGTQ